MTFIKPFTLAAAAVVLMALPNAEAQAGERRGPVLERGFDRGFDEYRGDARIERRGRRTRNRCRPRRALRKARRLGLRRAYVHRFGPRGVVIRGRARGERVAVRFGRAHFCPVRNVRVRGYRGYRG